jgi:hypothetical protein
MMFQGATFAPAESKAERHLTTHASNWDWAWVAREKWLLCPKFQMSSMNKFFFDQGNVQVTDSRVVLGHQVIVLRHVCALETSEKEKKKVLLWLTLLLACLSFMAGVTLVLGVALLGDEILGPLSREETQVAIFVLAGVLSLVAVFQAFAPRTFNFKITLQLSGGHKAMFITHERTVFNNVYRAINDALAFGSLKSF